MKIVSVTKALNMRWIVQWSDGVTHSYSRYTVRTSLDAQRLSRSSRGIVNT